MRKSGDTVKSCRWVKKDIVAYTNGELGPRAAHAVERHIAACPACSALWREEKRIEGMLASEMGVMMKASSRGLSWEALKHSIEGEADRARAAKGTRGIWEGLLIVVREVVFPAAARNFSEMVYWGKRATVPALGIFTAILFFHVYQRTQNIGGGGPMESASSQTVINIRFAPVCASANGGYYKDSGGRFSINQGTRGDLRYGWKQ